MKKSQKVKKSIKIISVIAFILVILLIVLLIRYYNPTLLNKITKKPRLFIIKDECSMILGNIIHKIKNEDECKIFCRNDCELRKIDFYNSELIKSNNSCHTCNCYCK